MAVFRRRGFAPRFAPPQGTGLTRGRLRPFAAACGFAPTTGHQPVEHATIALQITVNKGKKEAQNQNFNHVIVLP
jgi:hypothetical protein